MTRKRRPPEDEQAELARLRKAAAARSEGAKARVERARAAGKWGGGKLPWGFQVGEDGALVPNPDEEATLHRARELDKDHTRREVIAILAQEGRLSRAGKPFTLAAIQKMLGPKREPAS